MDGLEAQNVWLLYVADWVDRLVHTWHAHRHVIIPVLSIVSITLFFVLRHRPKRKDPDCSSTPPSPKSLTRQLSRDDDFIVSGIEAGEKKILVKTSPKIVTGRRISKLQQSVPPSQSSQIQPVVFFSTLTGTSQKVAQDVSAVLATLTSGTLTSAKQPEPLPPVIKDLAEVDLDDWFISGPKPLEDSSSQRRFFYVLIVPSYNIDTLLDTFLDHLKETHHDFRIDTAPLSHLLGFSVFGIGDREGWPSEEEGFCAQAVSVDKWLAKLTGGKRIYPLGLGDVKSDLNDTTKVWSEGLKDTIKGIGTDGGLGEGVPGSGDAVESDEEIEDEFPNPNPRKRRKQNQVIDLEDVKGPKITNLNVPTAIDFTTSSTLMEPPKAMVPTTSPTYAALTKQGYTIVGTHSGVKICRWTKSALRGRGSCYKNSFYGIKSHLCMETTPSLSCSNKCVFCWRHGTNPVSTTWRWQVDDPQTIFDGAKSGHYKKIKMLRGVPGVRAERFEEAMRIRHCALSLVGEPIFYPRINEFVGLLHRERISTFLVCNAQHPDQLSKLDRITQLYVSIDASNRDSLRRIDRPLHRDFWERFNRCLDILREKRFVQRTVFRLTLVKGFNVEEEVQGYADLVAKGLPCFVEIKGVTYCGTSTSAAVGLTMKNVPFYEEIVEFVKALEAALVERGLDYGIAAEHAHSCCVLLASKRFLIEGRWNTVIDYGKFFNLLEGGAEFGPEDYCKETEKWALWGNGGFDPADQRVDRKGRPKAA
ncbi:MAG: hypothetical protein Q9227_006138 [Pyrenula ochraceoflavens]